MSPLHLFLRFCENSKLEKEILDCGAGGEKPPLYVFHSFGYETYGIEISWAQIEKARAFSKEKRVDLDIRKGDMRSLPFEDCSLSFAYSYDSIFHMSKEEIAMAMEEIKRVLKKDGLVFVNFVSTEHTGYGRGKKVGSGEFIQKGPHGEVLISYFKEDEPDQYFNDFEILCKQTRIMKLTHEAYVL